MTPTPLLRQLQANPLNIAEFMREVLFSRQGYYRQAEAIGHDFTTAPEISQMFGELIGLWAVDSWQKMGCPSPFYLVELGPGRGTLMSDALRAAKKSPDFLKAMRLHLIEINSTLKEIQVKALSDFRPIHHENMMELPEGPSLFIANEFFDCLPIHQFQKTEKGWQELGIGLFNEHIQFVPVPASHHLPLVQNQTKNFVEISPMSISLLHHLASRFLTAPGLCLIIDYGYDGEDHGNTLQAMKDYKKISPLEQIGQADLTAHVDFAALLRAAKDANVSSFGPVAQRDFLIQLGIEQRAHQLGGQEAELNCLIGEDRMGTLFKVMAIGSPNLRDIAGFHA